MGSREMAWSHVNVSSSMKGAKPDPLSPEVRTWTHVDASAGQRASPHLWPSCFR